MATGLTADFSFPHTRGPTINAALALPATGITAFFGRSGCGKTTTLRCLAGLEIPRSGAIRFGTTTWFDADRGTNAGPQSRRIGYVPQEDALFPHLTVESNLAYGLHALPAADRAATVRRVADLLGVATFLSRLPGELSGGQRQRVALARALAPTPQLLLLDEPLSALDLPTRQHLRAELRRVLIASNIPAIVVTHDRTDVLAIADLVAVMAEGVVRQVGPVREVFARPADPDIAAIVGVETVVDGAITSTIDALSTVRVGSAHLIALNPDNLAGAVLVCIRGEDVILRPIDVGRESARNRLPAHVLSVAPEGPLARVHLDCGFPLTALVTRPSIEELGIREGAALTALIKAPSVHLIPR
jgi:molybdate transport system ATP-binding protein